MAYSRAARTRARKLFVEAGWSYRRVADELDVGKTTLLRWAKNEDWETLREQETRLELESRKLLLRMIGAAEESGDAQQTYAAVQAARLAGVRLGPEEVAQPAPKEVAVVLLDVLAKHPSVGPAVRGHRNEVIRLVLQEVERLESRNGGAPS